jgi:hypothetical protein
MISKRGLELSEPLARFSGVLTGTPTYTGGRGPLLGASRVLDTHDDEGAPGR